jgi:Domain of unknown function (DUF4157)
VRTLSERPATSVGAGPRRASAPRGVTALQRRAGNRAVTRAIQRLRVGAHNDASEHEASALAPLVASHLAGASDRVGHGNQLAASVRAGAEHELGADLSEVRVHTGAEIDRQADALDAEAFTNRDDVFIAGGAVDGAHSARTETLAHELTHVVQQRGGSHRVRTSSPPGIVQRKGKGHELQKTDAFKAAAKTYEHNLGFYAYNHDRAQEGAKAMIDAIEGRVEALHDKYPSKGDTDEVRRKRFLGMLAGKDENDRLAMKAEEAGQVGMAVATAIRKGNLRERYTMLYNAAHSNTFKALFVRGGEYKLLAGLLFWKGERHSTSTQTIATKSGEGWTANVFSKRFWAQLFDPKQRMQFRTTRPEMRTARTREQLAKGYERNGKVYGAPLSKRETRHQYGDERMMHEHEKEQQLMWHEGGSKFQVDETNPWVKRVQNELGMPVTTGPSGSTDRMLEAYERIGAPKDLTQPFILGLAGWMMTGNDHSFHEIMSVAKAKGQAPYYKAGAEAYHNGVPLIKEPELRANVAEEAMFPDEHAYMAQLEGGKLVGRQGGTRWFDEIRAKKLELAQAEGEIEDLRAALRDQNTRAEALSKNLDEQLNAFLLLHQQEPNYDPEKLTTDFRAQHRRDYETLRRLQENVVEQQEKIDFAERQKGRMKTEDSMRGGLSRAHLAALNVYTSPAYGIINPSYKGWSWLRTKVARGEAVKGTDPQHLSTDDVRSHGRLHGELITRALGQLPDYEGEVLYRGDTEGGRGVGVTETMKSLTSTSKKLNPALDYATGSRPALHIIVGPAGGKDITNLTSSGDRLQQVLIPPGLTLRFAQPVKVQVRPRQINETQEQNLENRNRAKLEAGPEPMQAIADRVASWTTDHNPGNDYPFGKTVEVVICYPANYDYVKAIRDKQQQEMVLE